MKNPLPIFVRKNRGIFNQRLSLFAFAFIIVGLATLQKVKAQAPYKGSELFVYNMEGQPPYTNKYPTCMKFVSFQVPSLYCPPPPPPPEPTAEPPSGGGGDMGACDSDGGLAFASEDNAFLLPPPGGAMDAFGNSLIGMSFTNSNASCSWTSNAARLTVCPTAGSNTQILGFYFETGYSPTITRPQTPFNITLQVLVNGTEVYTKTFTSNDRYNGFYATFPSSLNTASWEGKNVTFVVSDIRGKSIDDFAIIGTNNCSGKVCLGNLVWEDTNMNGIRDGGEPTKANVKMQIFRDDADGTFEVPTVDYLFEDGKDGLIAETTTDANGNYNVCLPAGNYFVRVTPDNFDVGKPLAGCFPTFGPSVGGNSDEDNKDHTQTLLKPAYKLLGMVSGLVTLAVGGEPTTDGDDANTNSTIDFGVSCDPSQLLNLGNLVWKDDNEDGIKGTAEQGIDGVTVELYLDVNANNTYDPADLLVNSTTTAGGGLYNFTGLLPGNYIVKVPYSNFNPMFGALAGMMPSPGKDPATDPDDNIDNDDNGIVDGNYAIITKAITLALGSEPTTDGDGNNGNLTVDIAVSPKPACTEYWVYNAATSTTTYNSSTGNYTTTLRNPFPVRSYSSAGVLNTTYLLTNTMGVNQRYELFYNYFDNNIIGNATNNTVYDVNITAPSTLQQTTVGTQTGVNFTGVAQNTAGNFYAVSRPASNSQYNFISVSNNWLTTTTIPLAGTPTYMSTRNYSDVAMDESNNIYHLDRYSTSAAYGLTRYNISGGTATKMAATTGFQNNRYGGSVLICIPFSPDPCFSTIFTYRIHATRYHKNSSSVYFGGHEGYKKGDQIQMGDGSSVAAQPNNGGRDHIYRLNKNFANGDSATLVYALADPFNDIILDYKIDHVANELVILLENRLTTVYTYRLEVHKINTSNGALTLDRTIQLGNTTQLGYTLTDFELLPCGGGGTTPPPGIPLTLGNQVWNDVNNDGIKQTTETGITNVGIVLFRDNGDGVFDRLTDTRWDSTTTNSTGNYLFTNLPKGDYFVWISGENFATGKPLYNYYSSTPTVANPNTDIDNDDNGINPETPYSHLSAGVASGKVTLDNYTEPTTDGDDANGNLTVDFGFYSPPPGTVKMKIGNLLWNDINNNLMVDAGETGIGGVTLTLFKDNGDQMYSTTTDTQVATTTSGSDGKYLFDNLDPGDYFVRVDKGNFDLGKPLYRYVSSSNYFPGNVCLDSVDHGNEFAFNWWVDGIPSTVITLEPNSEPPVAIDGDDGNGNLTIDFGFYRPMRIGNRIWNDTNNNGIRDTGEPDLNGVLVNIYKDDGDGVFNSALDIYLGRRTTVDSGYYNFNNLVPGSYFVQIPADNFFVGSPLAGLVSSTGVASENPPANNRDHGVDNPNPLDGGVVSQIVVLAYGTEPVATIDTDNEDGNFTIDFGFALSQKFDLGLKKVKASGQTAVVTPGANVKFTIKVYNQGGVNATNVQVTDYIPTGLTLNDANWAVSGGKATLVTPIPSINAGDSVSVDINFTVSSSFASGTIVNTAEISAATGGTDVDSTPDNDGTNDGTPKNDVVSENHLTNPNDDEDDNDIESITVGTCVNGNLEASVVLSPNTIRSSSDVVQISYAIVNKGTLPVTGVTFDGKVNLFNRTGGTPVTITLSKQGDVGSDNAMQPNEAWLYTGTFTTLYTPGDVYVVTGEATGTCGTNTQIKAATADLLYTVGVNMDVQIVDKCYQPGSTLDVNLITRLLIDEDAALNPGSITVGGISIPLPKRRFEGRDLMITLPSVNGGVAFDPFNPPSGIVVTAYTEQSGADGGRNTSNVLDESDPVNTFRTPCTAMGQNDVGCEFPDWVFNIKIPVPSNYTSNTFTVTASDDFNLFQSIEDPVGSGTFAAFTDITPATGAGGADTEIVPVCLDLALTKKLATGQTASVMPGGTVKYTIKIFNQGSVPAYNVAVVDYVPSGLILNDANWTLAGTVATLNTPIAGPIAVGDSVSVDILFNVSPTASGTLVNRAEIKSADDDTNVTNTPPFDDDSVYDTDPTNDAGGAANTPSDNAILGNGTGTPNSTDPLTDEDDSDPASITITTPVFDLALTKRLATGQSANVTAGSNVTFTISVINQGNIDATNVQLTDYIPSGFTLNDANWTLSGGTATLVSPISSVPAGQTVTRNIILTVSSSMTSGTLTNTAEISSASGGTDSDSTPDGTSSNDGTPKNDVVSENHLANPNDDEDDSDIESVSIFTTCVNPSFSVETVMASCNNGVIQSDAKLRINNLMNGDKVGYSLGATYTGATYASASSIPTNGDLLTGIMNPSSSVQYTVRVFNGSNTCYTDHTVTLLPRINCLDNGCDSPVVIATALQATCSSGTPLSNASIVIGGVSSGADKVGYSVGTVYSGPAYSSANSLPSNGVVVSGLANPSSLTYYTIRVFSGSDNCFTDHVVSLQPKVCSPTCPTEPVFSVIGTNPTCSGTTTLSNGSIQIVGVTSATKVGYSIGMPYSGPSYSSATSVSGSSMTLVSNIANPSTPITYTIRVFNGSEGCYIDQTTTITPQVCSVFDLALTKRLATGQSANVTAGSNVTFTISVINQGNIDATNVQLTDYIPSGFTLNDANWTLSGGTATLVSPISSVPAGQTVTRNIILTVSSSMTSGTLTNTAEISSASGGTDSDSTPDGTSSNDGTPKNDVVSENHLANPNDDEDDSDIESISVSSVQCTAQNAGTDFAICLPKTTANLVDASSGFTWVAVLGNPANATVNASTGVINGMTIAGVYRFRLQNVSNALCYDEIQITVTETGDQIVICNDGSTSYNLVAPSNLSNVIWYAMSGQQVGLGTTLIVSSSTLGLEDGSEAYYYVGTDGALGGCDVELCCPVKFITQVCCPKPNCVGITIIKNK